MPTSVLRTCNTTQDPEEPEHIVAMFGGESKVNHGFLTAQGSAPRTQALFKGKL